MSVALQDSIMFGAHFYSFEWMYETMQGMLTEHLYPNSTITKHPHAYIVFIQWALSTKVRLLDTYTHLGSVSCFEHRIPITDREIP
jgi:hypothetical protein